ncbi:hypothetical protein [Viridibacillus arvi]|uniref:hypothetical protein n=1 Tax=Viridibacillus arvi TaxID=263475 RepID=UPI0034CE83E3
MELNQDEYKYLLEDVQRIMNPILPSITTINDNITVADGEEYVFAILGFCTTEPSILLLIKKLDSGEMQYKVITNLNNTEYVQKTAIALVLDLFKDAPKNRYIQMFQHIIKELQKTIENLDNNIH